MCINHYAFNRNESHGDNILFACRFPHINRTNSEYEALWQSEMQDTMPGIQSWRTISKIYLMQRDPMWTCMHMEIYDVKLFHVLKTLGIENDNHFGGNAKWYSEWIWRCSCVLFVCTKDNVHVVFSIKKIQKKRNMRLEDHSKSERKFRGNPNVMCISKEGGTNATVGLLTQILAKHNLCKNCKGRGGQQPKPCKTKK